MKYQLVIVLLFRMSEACDPFLIKSRSAHPERRVVVFEAWKALKTEHGDRCWQAVARRVSANHDWNSVV